jgi:hypothetical protein
MLKASTFDAAQACVVGMIIRELHDRDGTGEKNTPPGLTLAQRALLRDVFTALHEAEIGAIKVAPTRRAISSRPNLCPPPASMARPMAIGRQSN